MINSKKILIFGVNDRTNNYISELIDNSLSIAAILDNDVKKHGDIIDGIKVIGPSDYQWTHCETVIIASRNFPVILDQLEALGVEKEDISLSPSEYFWKKRKTDFNAQNDVLLIANGFAPFIQSRVKKYCEAGVSLNVVEYQEDYGEMTHYEIEGVEIIKTGRSGLLHLLRQKFYSVLLVHFMNYRMASILELAECDSLPIIIWSHGYESLPWYRTYFIHTEEELDKKLAYFDENDKEKKFFLRKWFKKDNAFWVFVSDWHSNRVKKWVGYLPDRYEIIHNYIDEDYYGVSVPDKGLVTNILSIRSHNSNLYANDVVAKAILELSKREIFKDLKFTLYGFGNLFDTNFEKLISCEFPNVSVIQKKLSKKQMIDVLGEYGVFLAPTRYDSHGVTVAEMMAAGRCVITSSIPVMLELYDESCVSFCEGDNPWSLADEIEYVVTHEKDFLSKCKNAKDVIKHECGYAATIEKELELIHIVRTKK